MQAGILQVSLPVLINGCSDRHTEIEINGIITALRVEPWNHSKQSNQIQFSSVNESMMIV